VYTFSASAYAQLCADLYKKAFFSLHHFDEVARAKKPNTRAAAFHPLHQAWHCMFTSLPEKMKEQQQQPVSENYERKKISDSK
jgi:hypothetical protein